MKIHENKEKPIVKCALEVEVFDPKRLAALTQWLEETAQRSALTGSCGPH